MKTLLTMQQIASEFQISEARARYMTWQPDFPRPAERTPRERRWDRADVVLFFRAGGVVRC